MATTFAGKLQLALNLILQDDLDLSDPVDVVSTLNAITISNGAGANACNQLYHSEGSIAAGGNTTIDLAGSLTNQFGTTITFARIKLLYLKNISSTAGTTIRARSGASNGWNTAFAATGPIINKDGFLLLYAADATGYTVTAATGDIFRIDNNDGANAAAYELVIGGATS